MGIRWLGRVLALAALEVARLGRLPRRRFLAVNVRHRCSVEPGHSAALGAMAYPPLRLCRARPLFRQVVRKAVLEDRLVRWRAPSLRPAEVRLGAVWPDLARPALSLADRKSVV